jgi:uncharacterized protein (DUF433 family)
MIERIQINSETHFGKPCVAGTRITVQNVLELVNDGVSFDHIIDEYYPELKLEDIKACMTYAIALVSAEDINVAA